MLVTRINADAQATIPAAVLEELGLAPGDEVAFDIVGRQVVLVRPDSRNVEEHGPDDMFSDKEIAAALEGVLDDDRPTRPAEEVYARLFAQVDAMRRDRDAA